MRLKHYIIKKLVCRTSYRFLPISAHKIYGPKGIGALICNHESSKLQPLMLGGYQEAGLRSGTMPTHLVVGLGEAIKLLDMNKDTYSKNMINLKDRFIDLLKLLISIFL